MAKKKKRLQRATQHPTEPVPAAQAPRRRAWPIVLGASVAAIVLAAVVVAAVVLSSNAPETSTTVGTTEAAVTSQPPVPQPAARLTGKELFLDNCGVCHALRAAGTRGFGGPSLDELRPTEARVLRAIENGGRGSGGMPPNLLAGGEADRVAAFVARATRG